jgi:hypothetical protein
MGYVSASNTPTIVQQSAYGRATGGIGSPTAVNISGTDYEYLTFNSTGTLTVTTAGFFDYLAVGGGSGCRDYTAGNGGGGGGAGSLVQGSIYLSANQTITIGAGSSRAAWTVVRQADTTSIGTSIFAPGQANVGSLETGPYVGSGCGAVDTNTPMTLTNGLGKNAGAGSSTASGGGGGGFVTAGGNAVTSTGGAGGNGYDVSAFIGGSAAYVAGGSGGGGTSTGGAAGNGGVAGTATSTPSNGGANTGSGGGGGKGTTTTGNGGSGVCYIRYKV